MENISYILSEIQKLSLYKQKQIISKIEENIMLGSQITEITGESMLSL